MSGSDTAPAGYRGDPVGLDELLAAREWRAARQAALIRHYKVPVVSLTIVMPGPVKDNDWSRRALGEASLSFDALCRRSKWPLMSHQQRWQRSGPEALYAVAAEKATLKASTVELEDRHPIGRLWDFDVIDPRSSALSREALGFAPRRCLVCDRPARECGRSRRHPLDLLLSTIGNMMSEHHAAVPR